MATSTAKAVKTAKPTKKIAKSPAVKDPQKPVIHIKYADKSAGQTALVELFEAIKKIMEPYHKKRNLILHTDTGGQANLVSHKPVEIKGKLRKELWFVSALIQKGYVGFYYTPVSTQGDLSKHFSEGFVKSLKGKSCFHIKKKDPVLLKDIEKAIQLGFDTYVLKGWI
jgi:hypothetical protein